MRSATVQSFCDQSNKFTVMRDDIANFPFQLRLGQKVDICDT